MTHTDASQSRVEGQWASLLRDASFNADARFSVAWPFDARGRNAVLCDAVRGGRVLHLGFADHAPLIAEKLQQGVWLHSQVQQVAAACVGVDINADAVALATQLGVTDLHCLDIFDLAFQRLVDEFQPTHVLLPDVMEHLHDPIAFLQRVAHTAPGATLVVSVPNGLSLRNVWNAWHGVECINTDHLCWYSPFTVLKVLARAGYVGCNAICAQIAPASSFKGRVFARCVAWRSVWADNLVVSARLTHRV
jgi:hypothetical protein